MTFGIYVNGINKGKRFCEYYRGENYNVGSKLKSYSRMWNLAFIPVKYMPIWIRLMNYYIENFK